MTNSNLIKLSSNENCYGCSPLALEAIEKKYRDVHWYPESNHIALKEKIAEKFAVATGNIVVGPGSVKLIDELIATFVADGDEVLTFERSFVAYGQLAGFHHHNSLFAPLSDLRCAPENLLPFINEKTRLIFIANPNNPTGTIISHVDLESFLSTLTANIIVAVDEAYAEYVIDPSFPNTIQLLHKFPNLVILRSFSKIYGLAGLRIGYAIMDDGLASKLSARQIPFSLNYLSSSAAIAALADQEFVDQSAKSNAAQRDYLYQALSSHRYNTARTEANYMYLSFASEELKQKTFDLLLLNGIRIADLRNFGQEQSLRMTIGTPEVNKKFVGIMTTL